MAGSRQVAPGSASAPGGLPAGDPRETRLDRLGVPHVLRWGFLAVVVFMTGNAVETNFVAPHLAEALGSRSAAAATVISAYGLAVLVGSYLAGALSDLLGPHRVMTLGFGIWVVFEVAFLLSLETGNLALIATSYFVRGFGYPLFAFAFLVWINAVAPRERAGTAVGWFYVMFTGGLPTLGSLVAIAAIPAFGGGYGGETGAMWLSIALVVAGYALTLLVREEHGRRRLVPAEESAAQVLTSGVRLAATEPRVLVGFLVRIINTAPQYGMFIILPGVIAGTLGWSQSQFLLMSSFVYASNIAFNALFGALGDRWGWVRTVRWFGVLGSAVGLLLWWYVPHWVEPGSDGGYVLSVAAGMVFGVMLAGFVPLGAILPQLTDHKGAAMAVYTTAAGGAAFLGAAVVAVVQPWGGDVGTVWAFVVLYAVAFVLCRFLRVDQPRGARR